MTDLKKAQESLHKALERRRADVLASKNDLEEELQAYHAHSPVILSDDEMKELVEIVRSEQN